jgi:phosphoadenosine phosphosulfate reductase
LDKSFRTNNVISLQCREYLLSEAQKRLTAKPTSVQIQKISDEMESMSAYDILRWAIDTYGSRIGLASSFGAEDIVIIDLMTHINKIKTRVFTLDTGRLNQETYDIMDEVRKRYGISIEVYFPNQSEVEEMVQSKGMNLMYGSVSNRKLCCEVRKVHSLNRALSKLDGWITGLRREHTVTRANVKKIEVDHLHNNIVKVNPLADWTSEAVWTYIHKNNIPYNKLHDRGYPSIGCEPCTRAVLPNEDPRSGRWWWENTEHKECGLHWDSAMRDKKIGKNKIE